MRYISPADQVHFVLDLAQLPASSYTRVLRVLSAVLADWSWMSFAHAATSVVTLDEGLSARLPPEAVLISKAGLLQRDGRIAVIDIVSEGLDFVRQGRGRFDAAGASQLISTHEIGYATAPAAAAAPAPRGEDDLPREGDSEPTYDFFNFGPLGRTLLGYLPGPGAAARRVRCVVHESSDRVYVDARAGVEPGQKLYLEYVPDTSVRDAGGSIVIPHDAQLLIAYAVLEALYLVSDPSRSGYFNRKFVEARRRYSQKHTADSLSDIVRSFRTSYNYLH